MLRFRNNQHSSELALEPNPDNAKDRTLTTAAKAASILGAAP
jgi:hypothetical protein